MYNKQIKILKILQRNSYITQRELAKKAEISVGTVNNAINWFCDNEYIKKESSENNGYRYKLLEKGKGIVDESYIETAVILAAGLGTRLYSVTNNEIPKGLLRVKDGTLIDRSIRILLKNNIKKIIIVTGHLNNYYDDLKKKYSEVVTIKNDNYASTGSMASLAVASKIIENNNFLLLESDIIYESKAIEYLQLTDKNDCILLSGKTNSGDEVYVEVKNNSIHKMSKDKHSLKNIYGELVGISKISKDLLRKMIVQYKKSTNQQYHYEYAIEDSAKKYLVNYKKIEDLVWGEIDDAKHLKRINDLIVPKLIEKGEI
ncbi:winged helix-turn-helix transcriptional regulator [Clostridium botulinum]|uniref:winged helix-turn-helix transcriptional regulator n=1 Tax=Clostridium botulinum TaxID=1491 RepID=UPI0009B2843D|nr:winged helix-turn-helix transcriptional regulator [Clostridium botulinum]